MGLNFASKNYFCLKTTLALLFFLQNRLFSAKENSVRQITEIRNKDVQEAKELMEAAEKTQVEVLTAARKLKIFLKSDDNGVLKEFVQDVLGVSDGTLLLLISELHSIIVRSPFRAKHHVVVQYMAKWLKCPLPLNPLTPRPPCGHPPVDSMTGGRQGGQGRIDEQGRIHDITHAARDFALQLP